MYIEQVRKQVTNTIYNPIEKIWLIFILAYLEK